MATEKYIDDVLNRTVFLEIWISAMTFLNRRKMNIVI